MTIPPDRVNPLIEPVLFPELALAITFQALVDRVEETVLFVVESRSPFDGRLRALWSSSPQPLEKYYGAMREANREFQRLLHDVSGPFADE